MGCAGNIDGVMDGDLDGFLNAYLTQLATGELKKSKHLQKGAAARAASFFCKT